MTPKVGIVVPTLGTRTDYLLKNLASIKAAGDAFVILVAPRKAKLGEAIPQGFVDKYVDDPNTGLAEAINAGFAAMPNEVEFMNWLGDDDLLTNGSINKSKEILSKNTSATFVYGACDYIDDQGKKIWSNRSGQWAVSILKFGPDLIPQPGALFRREAFDRVRGLSSQFGWAFDFDLFIKLSKVGKGIYLPETLASFRWHPDSLSVGMRKKSVAEASAVRKSHLPAWVRPISILWEWPIMQVTLVAGIRVSKLAKSGINK